jgi:hypothetical protein
MTRRRLPCRWRRAASLSSCTPRPRPYPLPGSRPARHQARLCLGLRPRPPRPWPPRRSYGSRLASEPRPLHLHLHLRLRLRLRLRRFLFLLHRHLRHHLRRQRPHRLRRQRPLLRARPSDQETATETRTTVTPGRPASRLARASRGPMRRAGTRAQERQGPQRRQGPQPEALGSSRACFQQPSSRRPDRPGPHRLGHLAAHPEETPPRDPAPGSQARPDRRHEADAAAPAPPPPMIQRV